MIKRRSFLTALGSGLLVGGVPTLAREALDRPSLHQALVYAREGHLSFWSLQGQKYGAVDGALEHLWDIETIIAANSTLSADGVLRARVFETFYVFHPGTSEPLGTLSNPFTRQEQAFPAYPARPVDQTYETSHFQKQTETPVGLMTAGTAISPRTESKALAQLDIEKSIILDREAGSPMRIQEFLAYAAPWASYDRSYGFAEAALELTIWSDWLPWMAMDEIPGGLFTRAQGRKIKTLAELPTRAIAPLQRNHPNLLKDTGAFLAAG